MSRGILLHPWAHPRRTADRFRPTWRWLEENTAELDRLGYDVVHERLEGDFGYTRLMAKYWEGKGPLVILEHDLVPQFGAKRGSYEAFFRCPEEWCAVDYPLWVRRHARAVWLLLDDGAQAFVCVEHAFGPYTSFRHEVVPGSTAYWWGTLGQSWADLSCLGLTRFTEEFRRAHPWTFPTVKWVILDSDMAREFHRQGARAHIHYPRALHNHPVRRRRHNYIMPDGTVYKLLHLRQIPQPWRTILAQNNRNGPRPGPITVASDFSVRNPLEPIPSEK